MESYVKNYKHYNVVQLICLHCKMLSCRKVFRMDYDIFVSERITKLRQAKDVSARDMSLSMGQNENYINRIENRKSLPSLTGLFYICEYFNITLHEFFDAKNPHPAHLNNFIEDVKKLDKNELDHLANFVKEVVGNRKRKS